MNEWTWRKLENGRDRRGRTITRYESNTGWIVEQRKRHTGNGSDQCRSDEPRMHYIIIDAQGKQRMDTSSTVAGAKRAAEWRANFEAQNV